MAPKRAAETGIEPQPAGEEVAFPRGGGLNLPALEAKQLRAEGVAQARAEAASTARRSKRSRTDGEFNLVRVIRSLYNVRILYMQALRTK